VLQAAGSACCKIGCSAHTAIKHGPTNAPRVWLTV